uniref:Uncharacterized protein n=1 Tax=Physcomitrium patens TaxID=3218 RepID=A0A2K1L9D4_PHYPA|nr:hypothetical protein PHYPA_001047 [Physcomitrium patens]
MEKQSRQRCAIRQLCQANKLESRLELVYGFRQGAGIAMK